MDDHFDCPQCNRQAKLLYRVPVGNQTRLYYGCRHEPCRNRFQVLRCSGFPDHVIAQSPTKGTDGPRKRWDGVDVDKSITLKMGCPSCGNYGPIKMTYATRENGRWRRHKCKGTCGYYYTCQTEDGVVAHRKMKSLKAIDLFGEDDAA